MDRQDACPIRKRLAAGKPLQYPVAMDNPILIVVMRYIHIVSAVVAVGGMAFILFCVSPASRLLEENLRQSFLTLMHQRFLKVLWIAIAGLVISGAYAWLTLNDAYNQIRPWGQALIGSKVLIAIIIFVIVWLRSIGVVGKTPKGVKRVLMINIHLAAIVILLGAILRMLRMSQGV